MANTTISAPVVDIQDNILTLGKRSIQISNISQMSVQRKDGKRVLMAGVVLLVLSIIAFSSARLLDAGAIVMGVLFIGVAAALLAWYGQRGYYLLLEMNSGAYFWLSSRTKQEESFLNKAMYQLCACANNNMSGVRIDFSQCTITNSNVLSNQAYVTR